MNRIPKGELTEDLKDIIKQESASTNNNRASEKVEVSQSYVSSSPGFVPNQNRNNFRKNNKNKNHKK